MYALRSWVSCGFGADKGTACCQPQWDHGTCRACPDEYHNTVPYASTSVSGKSVGASQVSL
jgi:hypothetical protein